jgi:uroporphyrinogen-III synthase
MASGSLRPVVLARARDEAEASRARLEALGRRVALAPVTEIELLAIGPLPEAELTLATSPRAFAAFAARPEAERARLIGRPIYVVGPRSARAARSAGFVDVREAPAGDAAGALDLLARDRAGGRAVYLAGRARKPTLEEGLARLGVRVLTFEAYDARARVWDAGERAVAARAAAEGADALHYSRRSAELFFENAVAAGIDPRGFRHFALSEDAAGPALAAGAPARWAERPREEALFALLTS